MQITTTLKATRREMEKVFEFDDILSVTYYQRLRNGLYEVGIRIPECDWTLPNGPHTIQEVKDEVLRVAPDAYPVSANVTYANGSIETLHAATAFWLNERILKVSRLKHSKVVAIDLLH